MPDKLTCAEARQVDLVAYLAALGMEPQYVRGAAYWYLSPLRQERTASFKVDRRLNLWYDHGTGTGGTLIDFGLLYHRCSVGELLTRLARSGYAPASAALPLPGAVQHAAPGEGKITVDAAGPITSGALRDYLASRRIDEALAGRYCQQVHFTLYGKKHVALGFANRSGGYELRNTYFKGSTAPKDVTLLGADKGTVGVFEGFFSFLSFLQWHNGKKCPETNFLVLNSLALLRRATPLLEAHHRVHLYLDRDDAGRAATRNTLVMGVGYRDKSGLYRGYKDLNELLVQGRKGCAQALRTGKRR